MQRAVRRLVEYWADFGDLLSAQIIHKGADVYLITGTEHVLIFSVEEKRVKTLLQFDCPVTSISINDEQAQLYALCENKQLYCTTLSSSSSISLDACDDPVLCRVSSDSIVIKDGGVCSYIVAEGMLVTTSLHESWYNFDLYKAESCSTKPSAFQKHAGLQIQAVAQNSVDASSTDGMRSAPVLTCIYPNSSPERHTNKQHPLLSPLLFRLLFGVDASLVHSPATVCGLPDGRLVFFPLILPALTGSRGEHRTPIRIIYSLKQPIAYIGTSVVREQGPECLVVIGQNGKVLMVKANQASTDGNAADCSFIEHNVQGPVVCACVDGDHLYYSTSTSLFCLSLSKTSSSSSFAASSASSMVDGPALSPALCLNICRVITLAEPSISPEGRVQMLAVSLSGKLFQVTVPQESDKASVPQLTSAQASQKVKDLLAGIGNVWERATTLKEQIQVKNNIIKQLNQVLSICHLLVKHPKNDQDRSSNDKPPIGCRGVIKWNTLLLKDSLIVTCILENLSDCALNQGWTLCIQVLPGHSLKGNGSCKTFSFVLEKLDCGQNVKLDIPLEADDDMFLPVQIRCTLVYSLQSLLNTMDSRELSHLLSNTKCIALPLNTLTVDWLDALRIGEPTSHGGNFTKPLNTWKATQRFLNSRQSHTEEKPVPIAAPYTVAIHISSELLRYSLNIHGCSTAVLCMSVLKWLLCGTSQAEEPNLVQSPVVCAYSPEGQTVRLLAKEVMVSDLTPEGPLSVVEVQVESVSMAAVCGLHHALMRRVQVLLRDGAVKYKSPAQLKVQHICDAVRHLESLYKDLQNFREQSASDGVMTSRRTSESLFHFYLRLREKPLVIL